METSVGEVVYRFEGFALDRTRGILLSRSGEAVRLRHKSFELLRLFVENAGRLLTRDAINQAIWSDVIVNDDSITQCVRDIRRALRDESQTILKTVPRRGYIFAAKVTSDLDLGKNQLLHGTSDKPSIAVLAFANMSDDADQEYFSDGIADDIITELSRSRSLLVIARNSAFIYKGRAVDVKQVAQELSVRYVVEGSVRRSGGRIRVSAQLIDASTGSHIWAERYDREISEIFAVQDEIAAAVATAIHPAVGDAEQWRALRRQPASLGAWETYQRGLWHLSKGTPAENEHARELFRQAAEIDFGFAPAYVGLAVTYIRDGLFHGTRQIAEAARLAEVEARQAVAIDPTDSTAQAALGTAYAIGCNMDAAMICAERAIGLNRNCALTHWVKGSVLRYRGRHSECRDEVSTSLRLNPRDPMSATTASLSAMSWYLEGKYDEAVEASRRCLEDYPAYAAPRRFLVAALAQSGRLEEAAAELREFVTKAPGVFNVMIGNRPPYMSPGDQEHLLDGIRKAGWNDSPCAHR
jgi:adenylate cyclase